MKTTQDAMLCGCMSGLFSKQKPKKKMHVEQQRKPLTTAQLVQGAQEWMVSSRTTQPLCDKTCVQGMLFLTRESVHAHPVFVELQLACAKKGIGIR